MIVLLKYSLSSSIFKKYTMYKNKLLKYLWQPLLVSWFNNENIHGFTSRGNSMMTFSICTF